MAIPFTGGKPMPNKPTATWKMCLGTLLIVSTLAVSGCGARAGAGETAVIAPLTDQLGGAPLLADLPSLVISYSSAGEPSIGATPLSDLQALAPDALLSQLTLDEATIERMSAAGIQHIQLSNTPSGVRILVNGQPLPTLVWDANSLDTLLELLEPIEPAAITSLGTLLDAITNLGIGLAVRLPTPEGVQEIPLIVEGVDSNAAAAEEAQQAFMTSAGGAPVVQIPVEYGTDGTWTVQGLSDTEWQALTGLPFGYVRLNPDLVQGALRAGITQVIVWTDSEGIHVTIGDRDLPYVRWADGGIRTLVDLAMRLGIIPDEMIDSDVVDVAVEQWLPALQSTHLRIVVNFPEG
jgi:hypothetical protein